MFYKMNELCKPEIERRKTVSLSETNHSLLKKIGHRLECDSMDKTISTVLERIQGTDAINGTNKG